MFYHWGAHSQGLVGPNLFHVLLCSLHEVNGLVVLPDPSKMHWLQTTGPTQMHLPYLIPDASFRNLEPNWAFSLLELIHPGQLANIASEAGQPSADCAAQQTDSLLRTFCLGLPPCPQCWLWCLWDSLSGIPQSLLVDYHLRRAFPDHRPKMLPLSFPAS